MDITAISLFSGIGGDTQPYIVRIGNKNWSFSRRELSPTGVTGSEFQITGEKLPRLLKRKKVKICHYDVSDCNFRKFEKGKNICTEPIDGCWWATK